MLFSQSISDPLSSLQCKSGVVNYYPEHLPLGDLQRGVLSGKYLQGTFQASRENYLEANVSISNSEDFVSTILF